MAIRICGFRDQVNDMWRIVFGMVLILIAAEVSFYVNEPGASFGIFCGVIVGVSAHWFMTARASLQLENALVLHAKHFIGRKGYVFNRDTNNFIPNVHRLLRFDSQNIQFLKKNESSTIMHGPYYILKLLERNLSY